MKNILIAIAAVGILISVQMAFIKQTVGIFKGLPAEFYHLRPYLDVLKYEYENIDYMTWEEFRGHYRDELYYKIKIVNYAAGVLKELNKMRQLGQ